VGELVEEPGGVVMHQELAHRGAHLYLSLAAGHPCTLNAIWGPHLTQQLIPGRDIHVLRPAERSFTVAKLARRPGAQLGRGQGALLPCLASGVIGVAGK